MNYYIQTFGCQANKADSERMAGVLEAMGFTQTDDLNSTDVVVLNTCSVRQSAEDRVYHRMESLRELKKTKPNLKIVVAGCMVGPHGSTPRDSKIKDRLEGADKLVGTQDYSKLWEIFKDLKPTTGEYISKDYMSKKMEKDHGFVLISSGCNNFCTFCIVPFARGKEISRPMDEIIQEVKHLLQLGYKKITLVGQNVNSYGADLILGRPLGGDRVQINEMKYRKRHSIVVSDEINSDQAGPFQSTQEIEAAISTVKEYTLPNNKKIEPVYVKHLGRIRVPTLFPYLVETVAQIPGVEKLSFMSSNPWDFSDELIKVISQNPNIDRQIHLPLQSGDNQVLKRMNRWYTREEYLNLIEKINNAVPDANITTDIIVGFPSETEEEFQNTLDLVKKVNFKLAFISEYSVRPGTAASMMKDDVPNWDKKKRFQILDEYINNVKHSQNSHIKIGNTSRYVIAK
ncbi:MAG: MiaB/RimO family radical SAM methylthiotransferase [bacterium]|nr:MiaB/RimO family radical SAM methylthiotransferase [bacterium]